MVGIGFTTALPIWVAAMSAPCGACGGVLSPTPKLYTVKKEQVRHRDREYVCDICGFRMQILEGTELLTFVTGGAAR